MLFLVTFFFQNKSISFHIKNKNVYLTNIYMATVYLCIFNN